MDMCLSMSLPKGGYPFVIGDRSCGVFLAFKLVDEITTIARSVADSRLTHAMWRRVQCPHVGSASSHFFLRATHVKHPVFDFSLSMMVRQTPKTTLGAEQSTWSRLGALPKPRRILSNQACVLCRSASAPSHRELIARHVLGDYQGKCMDDHAVVMGGTVSMRNRERISMALQSIRTIPGMLGPSLVGWSRWVSAH